MSIIKMHVLQTGVGESSAMIDVPKDGVIRTITLGIEISDTAPATTDVGRAELSFLSSNQIGVNDARGSLCEVDHQFAHVNLAATLATIAMSGTPFCILTPIAVKVAAGERIYLHVTATGSLVAAASAYLFIDDGIDVARAQTRRR